MKIIPIIALIITGAVSHSVAQEESKRLPGPNGLHGPVRTLRVERATITNKSGEFIEGPRVLVMTCTYNEDGTRQERAFYRPDGSLYHKVIDLYDPDGRILETARYDGQGHLESRSALVYDSRKRLVEQIFYRPDGSVASRRVISHQGDERSSETVAYDGEGALLGRDISRADPDGKRSESVIYKADGTLTKQTSVVTNADRSLEIRQEDTEGSPPLREVWIPVGKEVAERVEYNPDGTIGSRERYRREFDSHGNFTKEVKSVAKDGLARFEPVEVTYWIITYY